MLTSHLVLLAPCKTAESVSLSSWDVWDLDVCVCVFECTSRGVVETEGQRVTEVNGKSAKPKSHTHPPNLPPSPPSHAFTHPSSHPAPPPLPAAVVSRLLIPQSQPLSLIMWASSMMNLPSLYFWLLSKACSCRVWQRAGERRKDSVYFRWQIVKNNMFISLTGSRMWDSSFSCIWKSSTQSWPLSATASLEAVYLMFIKDCRGLCRAKTGLSYLIFSRSAFLWT